jgi:glycerol uptake facilitator-like aquaporin
MNASTSLRQKVLVEAFGTGALLTGIVGSGIMAERLAAGNAAVALLANTISIGAILAVLIMMLSPFSGAHFNPVVSAVFLLRREMTPHTALLYVLAQFAGGILGVVLANAMFDLPLINISGKVRAGWSQGLSEVVATFGLIVTIFLTLRAKPEAVPMSVGLYILAACWFTASTCFANPAVTVARALSDTFDGIAPVHVPMFVAAQIIGAALGWCAIRCLPEDDDTDGSL